MLDRMTMALVYYSLLRGAIFENFLLFMCGCCQALFFFSYFSLILFYFWLYASLMSFGHIVGVEAR
jgi:hypothetical protein